MDTKSKKLSDSLAARVVAFILCVLLLTLSIALALVGIEKTRDLNYEGNFLDAFSKEKSFIETNGFRIIYNETAIDLAEMFQSYKDITNPASSAAIKEQYEVALYEVYNALSGSIHEAILEARDRELEDSMGSEEGAEADPEAGPEEVDTKPGPPVSDVPKKTLPVKSNTSAASIQEESAKTVKEDSDSVKFDEFFGSLENLPVVYYSAEGLHVTHEEGPLPPHLAEENLAIFDAEKLLFNDTFFKISGDSIGGYKLKIRGFSEEGVREEFETVFSNELGIIETKITDQIQDVYGMTRDRLNANAENYMISYYISDGENVLKNIDVADAGVPVAASQFANEPSFFTMNNEEVEMHPSGIDFISKNDILDIIYDPENVVMHFAFDSQFLDEQDNALATFQKEVRNLAIIIIVAIVLALIMLIWLIVVTGRKREDGTRKLYELDKIPAEICIAIFIAIFYMNITFGSDFAATGQTAYIITATSISFILIAMALWIILSVIRNIKAGLIIKRSLIYNIIKYIVIFVKKICGMVAAGFNKQNPIAKTILLVAVLFIIGVLCGILFALGLMGRFGGIFVLMVFLIGVAIFILAIRYAYKLVTKYGGLRKGIEEIVSGNVSYKIPVDEASTAEFDAMSKKVNDIGHAIDVAVQNELRKELMKTELISNVSHDLKTPLTSIITYTNLLKTEGLRSKRAPEYLDIIEEKGQRLNKLTEDLFSAAKAASGDIVMNKEKVDLLSLINQEIVELNGDLTDTGLDIQIKAEADNYYVCADSQLLWRVVDNLMTNVRKYALPGSRVYVEINESDMTTLQIKNISSTQLNIPAEELMERFKRGDESRTTTGSGLGLAIARDLVKMMGGKFDIYIDGDLFKVGLKIPTYKQTDSSDAEPVDTDVERDATSEGDRETTSEGKSDTESDAIKD